jgi:hypothetical protein
LDNPSAAAPDFAASARAFSAASRACCVAIDAAGKTMRFGSCVVKDLLPPITDFRFYDLRRLPRATSP